jgi:hypothetical protein
MEISFQTEVTEKLSTKIVASKIESGVFISQREILNGKESNDITTHFLDKEQLKDFIGALLHIQSKLNR